MTNKIKLFEDKKIRTHWDETQEKWYFSIVDVAAILIQQQNFQKTRNYWKVLKHRVAKEGNETVTNCNRLKIQAQGGKMRQTDVADTEQLLKLIQSILSKKAEPFKQLLTKVGIHRIEEEQNPELVLNMLAEVSTTEISKQQKPTGIKENKSVARKGGNAAQKARIEIEKQTGKSIVSSQTAKNLLGNNKNPTQDNKK